MFCNFEILNVFANIDLFGGKERERERCELMIQNYFPAAKIFKPKANGFGEAVKRLWGMPSSKYFLHIEDDWLCNRDITSAEVESLMQKFSQITLAQKGVHLSLFTRSNYRPVRQKLFGVFNIPNFTRPEFSTSPSFLEQTFGKSVSVLLNPDLHPEKQMFNGLNPDLEGFLKTHRSANLPRWWNTPYISDIGRAWHLKEKLSLVYINGTLKYKRNYGR